MGVQKFAMAFIASFYRAVLEDVPGDTAAEGAASLSLILPYY